ncbi:Hypothetical predicted protein [Pelobates cultripes]|uniref:Uncharacterized protein n=1 Tax=Pelobates cultripes TaxID=61616 RepID=A0AAD1RN18_PELCU|nr:Hypothetical predicted protein [Pelobates cultripes]
MQEDVTSREVQLRQQAHLLCPSTASCNSASLGPGGQLFESLSLRDQLVGYLWAPCVLTLSSQKASPQSPDTTQTGCGSVPLAQARQYIPLGRYRMSCTTSQATETFCYVSPDCLS